MVNVASSTGQGVAELWYEHDVLRGKLALVEARLACLPDGCYTLAQLIRGLLQALRHHTFHEEALLLSRRRAFPDRFPSAFAQLACDHRDDEARLRVLLDRLEHGDCASDHALARQGRTLVSALREHLAVEETEFFPLFELDSLGGSPGRGRREQLGAARRFDPAGAGGDDGADATDQARRV